MPARRRPTTTSISRLDTPAPAVPSTRQVPVVGRRMSQSRVEARRVRGTRRTSVEGGSMAPVWVADWLEYFTPYSLSDATDTSVSSTLSMLERTVDLDCGCSVLT